MRAVWLRDCAADWAARRTLYKTLGFIFVGIGLLLLGLMIYALLSRLGH